MLVFGSEMCVGQVHDSEVADMADDGPLETQGDDVLAGMIARLADGGERLVFSITETASLLGISRGLAYELARRGELPTMQLGRRRVVPRSALARYAGPGARTRAGEVA